MESSVASPSSYALTLQGQRISFEYDEARGGYGYSVQVDRGGTWFEVSSGNPFVRGPSFDLFADTVVVQGATARIAGTRTAAGPHGPVAYRWTGTVSADESTGWFRFRVTLSLPEALELRMVDGFEPEILLDMGDLPPYDRGDHVWFKINIDNPTKWNDEAQANDFPALYYFNAYSGYELMMYFDMTSMDWMSRDNIARFLNYRCGFRRIYKPHAAYELGMHANGFSGKRFPAGERTFAYAVHCQERTDSPTEQTALKRLVDRCLTLVTAESAWPAGATDWEDFSLRCAEDLMDTDGCWSCAEGREEYLISYVNGYSPAWEEAHAAKGNKLDLKSTPGLDAAVFIGYPLLALQLANPRPEYEALLNRILPFVNRAVADRIAEADAGNRAGWESGGAIGSWQFAYVMEQLWQIAVLNGDAKLERYAIEEVRRVVIPLARNTGYLFPLCFDRRTCEKTGAGDNYAVGGLYAYFMLELYERTGDGTYVTEARLAIRALVNAPINSLPQESFLLSMGVQAAMRLERLTGDAYYGEAYDYLLAQNVRMAYWFDDNTSEDYKHYNTYGLFQGCTPMFYPAFLENIECVARIASTFGDRAPAPGLLRLFNHARKNNFYYFPACLPKQYHTSTLLYVPLENLGVLEAERSTGTVGQEIYGCGQTFRAMLLWETFAKSADRDIMVLDVNGYREIAHRTHPEAAADPAFLVFNPERGPITTRIVFPHAVSYRRAIVSASERPAAGDKTCELDANRGLSLTLEADQFLYVRLAP